MSMQPSACKEKNFGFARRQAWLYNKNQAGKNRMGASWCASSASGNAAFAPGGGAAAAASGAFQRPGATSGSGEHLRRVFDDSTPSPPPTHTFRVSRSRYAEDLTRMCALHNLGGPDSTLVSTMVAYADDMDKYFDKWARPVSPTSPLMESVEVPVLVAQDGHVFSCTLVMYQ